MLVATVPTQNLKSRKAKYEEGKDHNRSGIHDQMEVVIGGEPEILHSTEPCK